MLGMGICSVKSAIALLEKKGYLKRHQIREKGKFSHYEYEYHRQPIFLNCSQVPVHSVDKSKKTAKKESPANGKPLAVNLSLTKTSLKSSSKTDIVPTVNPINGKKGTKNRTLLDRFKLDSSQREAFRILKIANINADDQTLCFFAKTYPFALIAGALEETKRYKPANPGAYLRKLLKMTVESKDYNNALNSAFAYDFKESAGLGSLKINKTHAEDENVKISLSMKPEIFIQAMLDAFKSPRSTLCLSGETAEEPTSRQSNVGVSANLRG